MAASEAYQLIERAWFNALVSTVQGTEDERVHQMTLILSLAGRVKGCRTYDGYLDAFYFVTEADNFTRKIELEGGSLHPFSRSPSDSALRTADRTPTEPSDLKP